MADNDEGLTAEVDQSTGEQDASPADDQQQSDSGNTEVPLKALTAERDKRQAAEARIAALEAAMQQGQTQAQQPQEQPQQGLTDDQFYDNPWQAAASVAQQVAARVKLDLSEGMARDKYGDADYEAKVKVFTDMAKADPTLIQQMNANRNPAQYAYNKAKMQVEYGGSDIDAIKRTVREEVEAELRQKYAKAVDNADKGNQNQVNLPDSFATAPGAGGASSTDVRPDTSLEAILGR